MTRFQTGREGLTGLRGSGMAPRRETDPMLHAANPAAHAAPAGDPHAAPLDEKKARLLAIIREKSFLTEGGPFKLASGGTSDYYLDMKPTMFSAEGLTLIADVVYGMVRDAGGVDAVGGLELGAVPIASAVSMRSFSERPVDAFVVRKEKKDHGTAKKIDGNFRDNAHVVLFEDVTTRGGSVMEAVHAVRARGATVTKIITLVDRLEGAAENLRKEGIELQAVFTISDLRK
jgi:orotate phosphoribosyltransferase